MNLSDYPNEIKIIRHYARKYYPYYSAWLQEQDLFQAGLIGLWQAIKNYTPDKSSFVTYAHIKIRGAILDETRRACPFKKHDHFKFEIVEFDEAETLAADTLGTISGDHAINELLNFASRDERELRILQEYLIGESFNTTAAKLGLSGSRVVQLFNRLIDDYKCSYDIGEGT